MRGKGIRAWSPIVGGLAIGLCLFGLSIKDAPAEGERSSSDPRKADVKSVSGGAVIATLQANAPAPATSNRASTDNPTVGYSTAIPAVGNRFGADDELSVFRSIVEAPTSQVTQRNGGTALQGDFCICDADCETPASDCEVAKCSADQSGGGEVDVGEQYTCQIINLANGAECDLDGLFCTADECDGAGACIVDPDAATLPNPCLKRCDGFSANANEACGKDQDCQGGACLAAATCDDTNDICIANGGDVGRCCAYDVNGDVDVAISGYKSPAACFAANSGTATGLTWRRVQDTVTTFRCPKYSAGIADTFDAGGALIAPTPGSVVGTVRRTDKVCAFDLTPCEDTNLGCLKVCVQTSDGMLPTVQPQSCTGDTECVTLGDGTATCQSQACAPLTCGQDSTHTACTGAGGNVAAVGDPMRCSGQFRIGDDYSVSNGSFIALKQFSYRGGVDHAGGVLVFDFWDSTGPATCTADGSSCAFIGESCASGAGICWGPFRVSAFAVAQTSNDNASIRTIRIDCGPSDCFGDTDAPSDPEFRIPGTGYVTMRSSRGFNGKANGSWLSAGAPDVGINDDTLAWQDGGPTTDDSLIVGNNNDGLAFEIVGDKIPEPLGACCGITQLVCSDSGLASECVGLFAGNACGAAGTCGLSAEACDDVHRYECATCQGGGPRLGQLCSATRECSPSGTAVSICTGTDWKGARFNSTTPSLCASDVCNIGGCCTSGVCVDTTAALCMAPGSFLGGGTGCFAAVTRQQGGGVTPFTDPDHNCCPQTHTYGVCCEDTPYCAGDASANASCNAGNTGTDCGTLFCDNYAFNFVCTEVGGDGDCGQGAAVGDTCGGAGTCQLPCGGAAGDNCSSTPYCANVIGNPPCPLVCSEVAGDCTGSIAGADCGGAGTCGFASLGSTCFGSGTCTQSVCVQPSCDFCTGPVETFLDVLNSPTTVCANSGVGCDAGNDNGGLCDCPQNAGICNFVCANDGVTVCTLATADADCGAGQTCGVVAGAPVETCTAGLPLLTTTLSGTRPLKDDPQDTGLTRIFDFDDGDTCTLDAADPGVYEVFRINEFSRVTVDLCCKVPVFAIPYIVLFEACNCSGFDFILSNIGQAGVGNTGLFGAADNKADIRCESDANLSMTFDLPPGSYAYPLNSNRTCSASGGNCDDVLDCPAGEMCSAQAERDYQLHISAIRAQVAPCCNGVNCTLTTKLECVGNDQLPTDNLYFPGGPNSLVVGGNWLGSQGPEDAIVGTPVLDCSTSPCSLGACCGGTGGVASCSDVASGGGGSPGDGISEADCATDTGNVGIYQGGLRCSDDPCPACPLNPNSECQVDFASISDTSDRFHAIRSADDFIPNAATINRLCWSGVWGGTEAGVNCNDDPPDANWYYTIFEDDGNGLPGLVVGSVETQFAHDGRTIIDLQAGFKPTSYSGPVSIAGLTPGNCYWIEITGEGSGDLSAEACSWNWFYTDTSAGQGAESESQDGNGWSVHVFTDATVAYTASNLVKNDRAFCVDSGMDKNTVGNEGLDGGCGDRTGTFACCYRDNTGAVVCSSAVSLYECILNPVDNGLAGTAYAGTVCVAQGGTHVCTPPVNDDCDTAATVIAPASCPEVTNVGNCAKNKASWCSPLFQQCAGTDGLCIPILDDMAVESTSQFDCAIQPTDNRFATGDGPPSMNNTNGVLDDCSGSDNGGGPFRADVWWKVTAPCTGKMSVTMCGGGVYDAMMATFTACPGGNDPSAPTLIECNDDACGTFGTVSEIPAYNVTDGQEVTIRIGGWSSNGPTVPGTDGEAGQGQSDLHVRFACFIGTTLVAPEPLTGEASFSKDRYISAKMDGNGATPVAIRVVRAGSTVERFVDCNSIADLGADGWYAALQDGPLPAAGDPSFYCNLASVDELHVRGCNILPGNMYAMDVSDNGTDFSATFDIITTVPQFAAGRQFGDIVGSFIAGAWTAPEGLVSSSDIVAVVKKFQSAPGAPIICRVNNSGVVPNTIVSAAGDVLRAVNAFNAAPYDTGGLVTGCLTGTCVPDPACEP